MVSVIFALTLVLQGSNASDWKRLQCEGAVVVGRYLNAAQGFSVDLPDGLRGRRGRQAGPERGVGIPLSDRCEGVVVIWGEPNSVEWRTPDDAVSWRVAAATSEDRTAQVVRYPATLGSVPAAGATIRFSNGREVEDVVVAFRPGGEPVYTALLSSSADRYARDHDSFKTLLTRFRLEEWR